MSIHNIITKKIMIIELIIISLLYIFPLGPYNADNYNEFLETEWFQVERLPVAVIVGCCVSLVLLKLLGMKVENKYIKSIVVGLLSIPEQIIMICGIYWFYKIYNDVGPYERIIEFAYAIGIFLLSSSLVLSVFIILKMMVYVLFTGILKRDIQSGMIENSTIMEGKQNTKQNAVRIFMRIFNIVVCIAGCVFMLTDMVINTILVSSFTWILFESIKLLIIVIPMIIYLIFFVDKWIKSGKWINVVISYLWLIYLTYDLLSFILVDYMFYTRFATIGDWKLARIVCATVCFMITVSTIIMIICGIIDKRLLKKSNLKSKENQ